MRFKKRRFAEMPFMQKGLAALIFVFCAVPCPAQEKLPSWDANAQKAWWTQNPSPDQWPKAADELQAQLEAAYKQGGPAVCSQADFQGWLEHLEWIRLGLEYPDVLADAGQLKTFIALGQDEAVSHLFVRKLEPLDDPKAALQILLKLAGAQPDDLHEYAALGVAYSVVFDQPFPGDWPHFQVRQEAVPIGDTDVVQRFNFYVQANRNRKTDLDLTQLPVEDLKFLVDSKVKLSELEYAQNEHLSYTDFANAFFAITYDKSRVQSTSNMITTWPFPAYSLADIEKQGGICVDQAYYASMLGKGRGIPTIFITGQGSDGGHAWFAYLSHDMRWVMDCGRYANQNYLKGYATDPQTWREVTDTTIEYLVKNGPRNPNYQAAKTALAWARMHSGDSSFRQLLDDARAIMPELAETWQAEGGLMDGSSAIELQDKKAFYQAWITQFQSDADLKVDGQTRLLALLKQANDPDAGDLQKDIVLQNRSSGADLGIKGSFSAIEEKIKAEDWDGAKLEFQKAVRDFNEQGGGTFFNEVVVPYAAACAQHGQIKQAKDGIKFTEDRMSINSRSILGVEFAKLKEGLDTLEKVQPDMDKWLGEIDDGNYEQSWNEGAKTLQAKGDLNQWIDYLTRLRKPLGKCTSRTFADMPDLTRQLTSGSGKKITGTFLFARYNSIFETQPSVSETLIFQKEDDGAWRPMEYYFKSQGAGQSAANP